MLRLASRFALTWGGTTAVALVAELFFAWPRGAGDLAVAGLLLAQLLVWTSAWTLPLAGLVLGLAALLSRARVPRPDLFLLPLAPPAALCAILLGQWLHVWAARAFVRPALIARWLPAVELFSYAAVVFAFYVLSLFLRPLLEKLERRWVLAAAAALGAGAVAALVALSPAILDLPLLGPALLFALAAAVAVFAARWAGRRAPDRRLAAGGAGALLLLGGLILFLARGGQAAPLAYPVAAGAIQRAGLVAARVAALASGFGDDDRDGFGRYFGGLDCDDEDPLVHPQAKERPGNGVDDDCFEGDLSPEEVAEHRRQRAAGKEAGAPRARGLIIITVDALRADAVGFGGSRRPTSPNLDRIAEGATVFSRAYSQAPRTRYSFPSIFSGLYPSNIHWHVRKKGGTLTSHDDNLFLAEVAQKAGIETATVLSASHARLSHWDQGFVRQKVHPASRFRQHKNAHVLARDAVNLIEGWADNPGRRFFLWMHFYEPHFPYVDHETIDFGSGDKARYLEEVKWVDEQLGEVFAALEESGLAKETAIVFTADHGEEFGEHGGKHHGDLHVEDLHVPLLIRVPGAEPRRIDEPVGLVDASATMYEILGLDVPSRVDGDSLLSGIDGGAEPAGRGFVYAERIRDEKNDQWEVTLLERDWQLILDLELNARQLYHLRDDPFGTRNVLTDYPGEARRLERRLRRHLALQVGPLRVLQSERQE